MKNTNRAAAAAALVAVGLALSTGAASAASAPRITTHEQLRASIAAAVAAESAKPALLSTNPAGTPAAALSTRPVGIVSDVASTPIGKVSASASIAV